MLYLRSDFARHFSGADAFDRILSLEGEVFRELAGRRTLRFTLNRKGYFIKIHRGVGWKEIFKNLFQLRLPVLGAQNEWRAIMRLDELDVDTMTLVGYGSRGWNPARMDSFVITEELEQAISLEDFCRSWATEPPAPKLKRILIKKAAEIAHRLHGNGVNHRDFYICHFLLDLSRGKESLQPENLRIYLIDLHRVQIRRRTPRRWIVKDVAGLFFSSMDIGLTQRDCYRFIKAYGNKDLRETLSRESGFWRQVFNRAVALYKKDFGERPCLPFSVR